MKEPTINGTFSCGVAAGVWVCVGVSVVLCFHSLLPLFWTEMFYKWASKSQYLVFLFLFFCPFPPSFTAGRWMMLLIPRSGGVEWQMTEVLVQQEGEPKREATTERLATADNRENRKGQAHRLGGEVEVSDRIYRCCSCSLSLHSLFSPHCFCSFISFFFFLPLYLYHTENTHTHLHLHSSDCSIFLNKPALKL